ncbi:AhpC/TSA family protein [Flavobacteriaceae bacterium]|nr:AhpC/TSA family protein [Flavobacteriaceae bacterium]
MLHKIISSFVLILLLTSCQGPSNALRLKGTVDLSDGNAILHIISDLNNQPRVIDTLPVRSGSFDLEVEIIEPGVHFLQIQGDQASFPFIAEPGTVNVEIYKDSLGVSKATGTTSNDDFMRYKLETRVYIASLNGIGNDLQQAMILKDSLLAQDLQEQYQDVRDQIKSYELSFIKEASDSFISILILERFVSNKAISISEAREIFEGFSDRIKMSASGKGVEKQLIPSEKPEVGEFAPLFNGPNPDGIALSLKDRLGKVTILDFWASWCRPCRVENPSLVRLYQKHQDSGLRIVSVSLDKAKPQWVQAIADDGLIWDHISNLKFWNDPIAKLYHVSAIPATFILDEKGVIVAQDLRGIQLERKVEELLRSL